MDFKQLCDANAQIKTTPIKGKEYAEVPQRVKAFRMLYPEGTIKTEIVSIENGVVVIRATVGYYENNLAESDFHILGVGHAYEKEGNGFINQTSYIENCETSAVGRALGFVGIGSDTSIASFEEVANAKEQQEQNKRITAKDAVILENTLAENQKEYVLKEFGLTTLSQLTRKQYAQVLESLNNKNK